MAKDKKAKLIKRIYEQGRETTVTSKHKAFVAPKKENELLHKKRVKGPSATSREVQAKQKKVEAKTQVVAPRPFVDAYDLPSYPEKSRLALLVKDPSWIFAYWEISPDQIESVKNTLSDYDRANVRVALRMYDVTLVDFNGYNANHWFDIEVGPNASNWYIKLWHDSVSYIGDIGLKMPSGNFITLVRSNVVHTPRRSYSPRTEQIWMKVEDTGHTAPYIVPQLKSKAERTHVKMPENYKRHGDEFYLSEDDIRQYYSRINPFLRDIISSRLIGLYGKKAGRYGFIIEGDTEEERQRLLSWLPKGAFLKRLKIGASEELVMFGGGSEFSLKSSEVSSEFFRGKVDKEFFFEIATELIVSGRTSPDAEVYLGSKKVPLNKDGTFRLHFSLPPDGKIPLEFRAVSNDKTEVRTIDTHVERRTE